MNRVEFMMQLESLLQDIAPGEREEALQYYNDYFDDAGEENEQEVIEALGTPAKVAENIKRDLLGDGEAATRKPQASDRAMIEYGNYGEEDNDSNHFSYGAYGAENDSVNNDADYKLQTVDNTSNNSKGSASLPGWAIALLVVLIVLASPIGIGILSVIFGLIVTWFSLILSFGAVALVLFVVLVLLVIAGIMCVAVDPWVGIALIGGGLLCGGLGVLFMMLTVGMAGGVTPAVCRGIGSLFRRKKHGNREDEYCEAT